MTDIKGAVTTNKTFKVQISKQSTLSGEVTKGMGTGSSDYERLNNKPSINDVELSGNLTLEELGAVSNDQYATKETHGIVKVGSNLFIDNKGNLEAETPYKSEPLTNLEIEKLLGD